MFKQNSSKTSTIRRTLKVYLIGLVLFVSTLATLSFGIIDNNRGGLGTETAYAAESTYLNFQARLRTASGGIVPDGFYNIEFKIYNANSSSGSSQGSCTGDSNCLWTETRIGGNQVRVANGYTSVSLGSVNAFPSTIDWSEELWLTMRIGGTGSPSWDSEMTSSGDRLQLTAIPYAFKAKLANNVASGDTNSSSTNSGNVSVTTGDASGATSNSGNITIDVGTATGTTGTISLGASNASSLILGRAGLDVQVDGGLVVEEQATFETNLRISDGSSNYATINSEALAGDYTVSIPTITGNDTFCLETLSNCIDATAFHNGGDSFGGTATLGTNDNFGLNFEVNNTTIATISNTGQTVFQNASNSTNAFQVQNASGSNSVLNVDTINGRVGVGTASPSSTLELSQAVASTTTIGISYNAIPVSSTDAFGSLDFRARNLSSTGWTTSYNTSSSSVESFVYEDTNDAVYAAGASVYRCLLSTGCDESGDWTISYTPATDVVFSLVVDYNADVIYAGVGSTTGVIYRCALSTGCDAQGDWTTSYDTPGIWVADLFIDTDNNMLYALNSAGGDGRIYTCDLTTSCDASGDWTSYVITAASPLLLGIAKDTVNDVLYIASADGSSAEGIIVRCDLSTNCDASGDWSAVLTLGKHINDLVYDSVNGAIFATTQDSGRLYRCDITTNCDVSGDWAIAYDTTELEARKLEIDLTNNKLYFGTHSGGIIYTCSLSTVCESSGDWTVSYDTPETSIRGLYHIASYDIVLAGSASDGIIYRLDASGSSGSPTNFSQINAYAVDTTDASEAGAIGITTLVNGSAVQGFYLQGATATLGTDAVGGELRLSDGSSNYATIGVEALAGDYTVSIPTITGNDIFCLETLANCGDVSSSLTDNITDALDIQQGTDNYLNINTTDTSEEIQFGNINTNPDYTFLGSGTLSVAGAATITGQLTIGTSDITGTLLVLDTKTDSGDPSGTNGAMYYNSNLGKFRCYQNSGWVDCITTDTNGAGNTKLVTITPEYEGAIFTGSGTGYLNSSACGNQNDLSLNTGLCGAGEKHSYYEWTSSEGSAQAYSIFVRYQLPSDFSAFSSDSTINLFGRRTASTASVSYTLFQANGTRCGSVTTVTSSNDTWQEVALTGSETGCSFAAGDIMTFQIDLSAYSDSTARVGELRFSYTTAF